MSRNPPWDGFDRSNQMLKHEPASDIDTVVADSLKRLPPNGRLEKQTSGCFAATIIGGMTPTGKARIYARCRPSFRRHGSGPTSNLCPRR